MLYIFVINKWVSLSLLFICRVAVKDAELDGVPGLTGLVSMLVYDKKTVNFSRCVATPLNEFRKNVKCMTQKQKWYMTLTSWVLMWATHTIITWSWLAPVINFWMCTKLTTEWVIKSGDGVFSFRDMASYLSICTLFTNHFLNMTRWMKTGLQHPLSLKLRALHSSPSSFILVIL